MEKHWRSGYNHDYKLSRFPALPNLNYLDISVNSIGKSENLQNLNFPYLSTLTLNTKQEYNFHEQTRWSEIFLIIKTKFGDTLERLSVKMESHDSKVLNDTRTCKLNLAKLKEFRLLVNGPPVSLNFLLPMKDLLKRICVLVMKTQGLEGATINMLDIKDIRAMNATKFCEFIHFDKSFGGN